MCEQQCDRQEEIDSFIEWCNQPYDDYMSMTASRAEEIAETYFAPFRSLSDEAVCRMLGIMRRSIEQRGGTGPSASGKGAASGWHTTSFDPQT